MTDQMTDDGRAPRGEGIDDTGVVGRRVVRRGVVDSTMKEAWELVRRGAPEGTVVVAERQRAGRGRQERVWHSPEGGLYFSVLLAASPEVVRGMALTILAGLAMAETIRAACPDVPVVLEWPNDLMVGRRKVAGILAEMRTPEGGEEPVAVLGVGVNVAVDLSEAPAEVRRRATSLDREAGGAIEPDALLSGFCRRFDAIYRRAKAGEAGTVLSRARALASFLGRTVRISDHRGSWEATAVELDPQGVLLVETPDGERRRVYSGDLDVVASDERDMLG